MMVIFIFAHPMFRKKAFKYFWLTHSLYIALYLFALIHGLARLTGEPRIWIFFIGPGIVFTLDKVISLQTRYMELDIIETELLPSDVIKGVSVNLLYFTLLYFIYLIYLLYLFYILFIHLICLFAFYLLYFCDKFSQFMCLIHIRVFILFISGCYNLFI